MIGLTLLGGYLGAGKTTLVNQMLRRNNSAARPQRIALLINDFGDINIDAALIESQTDNQINLANGCVCCTVTDGFYDALDNLQNLQPPPEHIVVEASGVADVYNLSQYGRAAGMHDGGVVVVADAETIRAKAEDKYVAQTVQRQLKSADLILLNKVDLVDTQTLGDIESWLVTLTDNVSIVPTQRCDVPLALILNVEHNAENIEVSHSHEAYAHWSYASPAHTNRKQLEDFVDALDDSILRGKGLVEIESGEVVELQVVGKRREILVTPQAASGTKLVLIGLQANLDKSRIETLAQVCFS